MNLTATRYKIDEKFCQKLQKLAPPSKGYMIYKDAKFREFAVRVTDGGTIAFILNFTVNGNSRRFTIGTYPGWTVSAARDEAQKIISSGRDPIAEWEGERAEPTVADLAHDFLMVAEKKKRESSLRQDRQMIAKVIIPKLGGIRAKTLTNMHVQRLHGSLKSTPVRANRVLALLSAMWLLRGPHNP